MARKVRSRSSINLYHVIIRGINKQTIFVDKQDKMKIKKEILKTKEKLGFKLYAYVIMPNHLHLVIKEENEDISKIMHRIQVSYSEYLNMKYERIGSVFQGRFNSKNIEDEEYLKCAIRYIHFNPEKAGIANYNEYEWSSYKDYMDNLNENMVDKKDILKLFGDNEENAKNRFEQYHKEKNRYAYINQDTEFELVSRLDDDEVIKIITEEMKIPNIYEIQKYNNRYRDDIILKILEIRGTTSAQISRITGISIRIIEKIKRKKKENSKKER